MVSCDPRGTQFRGREFEHSTYRELGKLETEDFIDLAEHLGTWEFVDADRIGIQGWSYGGFMDIALPDERCGRVQRRHQRGTCHELALLRHDLHGALHAHPARKRTWIRRK